MIARRWLDRRGRRHEQVRNNCSYSCQIDNVIATNGEDIMAQKEKKYYGLVN
jgi:hypothetical protein